MAGYLVPNVFWAGVVLPALTFAVLYAWPWIDRRITGDRAGHHILEEPRRRPFRVAVLVGAVTFLGMLLLAGAEDIAARWWGVPVRDLVRVMRVATLVVPAVTAGLAYLVTRRLLRSRAPSLAQMPWTTPREQPDAPRPGDAGAGNADGHHGSDDDLRPPPVSPPRVGGGRG